MLFCLICISLIKKEKPLNFYLLSFVSMLSGLIIVFLAPGNFIRAKFGQNSLTNDPMVMIKNYIRSFEYIWSSNHLLLILSLIVSIVIFLTIFKFNIKFKYLVNLKSKFIINFDQILIKYFNIILFLTAALGTIIPFIIVPDFMAPRTEVYFCAFIFLFIIINIIKILFIFTENRVQNNFNSMFALKIITYIIFSVFILIISKEIELSSEIKKQMFEREQYLYSIKGSMQDVIINPISGQIPFSVTSFELSTDNTYFVNREWQDYFGLNTIKMNENTKK
jgi:hypothetical protein